MLLIGRRAQDIRHESLEAMNGSMPRPGIMQSRLRTVSSHFRICEPSTRPSQEIPLFPSTSKTHFTYRTISQEKREVSELVVGFEHGPAQTRIRPYSLSYTQGDRLPIHLPPKVIVRNFQAISSERSRHDSEVENVISSESPMRKLPSPGQASLEDSGQIIERVIAETVRHRIMGGISREFREASR